MRLTNCLKTFLCAPNQSSRKSLEISQFEQNAFYTTGDCFLCLTMSRHTVAVGLFYFYGKVKRRGKSP